jgi:hypothetical protein
MGPCIAMWTLRTAFWEAAAASDPRDRQRRCGRCRDPGLGFDEELQPKDAKSDASPLTRDDAGQVGSASVVESRRGLQRPGGFARSEALE